MVGIFLDDNESLSLVVLSVTNQCNEDISYELYSYKKGLSFQEFKA